MLASFESITTGEVALWGTNQVATFGFDVQLAKHAGEEPAKRMVCHGRAGQIPSRQMLFNHLRDDVS